jgi:drug/metabolite transporter (DMT)-like permease
MRRRGSQLNKGRDRHSDLALLAILAIWVVSYIFFKLAFREMIPMAFNAARFALLTPVALLVLWLKERNLRIERRDFWPLLLSSVVGHGIYQVLYVTALDWTTAPTMALIGSTIPVFAVVFLTLFRMERLVPVQWLGVGVSMVGVILFVEARSGGVDHSFGVGALMGLGAAMCFALYGIINKPLLRRMTSNRLMAMGLLLGLIPIVPAATPAVLHQNWAHVSALSWFCVVWAGFLPLYLAYMLWNWAIARQGLARTTVVSYLVPAFTAVVSRIFLGDKLTLLQVIGGLIVLGGVALTRRAPEIDIVP